MDKYIHSTWSNIFFPAFAWLATGSMAVTLAGAGLMVGSGAFHWLEAEKHKHNYHWWRHESWGYVAQKADEIGMFLYFLVGIWWVQGGTDWTLAYFVAMAVAMGIKHREFGNETTGVLALLLVGCAVISSWVALTGLLTFGMALGAGYKAQREHRIGDHKRADIWHGVWHLLAAVGYAQTLYFGMI